MLPFNTVPVTPELRSRSRCYAELIGNRLLRRLPAEV